jgi:hypothetical protein
MEQRSSFYLEKFVEHRQAEVQRQMAAPRLNRRYEKHNRPHLAQIGEWMIERGTQLKERYGSLTEPTASLQPKREPGC